MAVNLMRKGIPLVVFDHHPPAVEMILEHGNVDVAASPKQVVDVSSALITMLPSSPHVKSVYFSEDGVLASLRSSSASKLMIDCSTIDPASAVQVWEEVRGLGHDFVDAPVSGGVGGAEHATLTFMVGGEKKDFEKASELLKFMGKNIVSCGKVGTGQTAKIVNNLILAISMVGVAEGMHLGEKLGIDPKVLASIVNSSSGRCWSSDTYNPCPGVMEGVPSARDYQGGFACALMKKDLGLALDAAASVDAPLPLGAVSHQLYTLLSNSGMSKKDFSVIFQFLKEKR